MSFYISQFKFLRDRRERIISPALIRYFFLFQYPMDRKAFLSIQSFQSISHVRLFVIPRASARQATLSIPNSQSLLKLMSIESVMPSNHLILCHPLLLPSSIFPSIMVFSKKSVLHIRWPKYWSFSSSISPPCLLSRGKIKDISNSLMKSSYVLKDLSNMSFLWPFVLFFAFVDFFLGFL